MTDTAQAQSTEAKLEENEIVPDGSVSPANVPADIPVPGEKIPDDVMKDLVALVWGPAGPDRENLHRWSQGFAFSSGEPTALVQLHGGPCAVIAPVQAYLLKNAIFSDGTHPDQNWRAGKNVNLLLATTFTELFSLLSASTFTVVLAGETLRIPAKRDATAMDLEAIVVDDSPDSPNEHGIHAKLRMQTFSSLENLKTFLHANVTVFCTAYGVLRFLYSLILSKTINSIKSDFEDPSEPLIDGMHGHGNQSLINFVITGTAVANVWDNFKEFGALRLQGIPFRPAIGFLSLLENMRYVEVGFYLKCPQFPIWILGSETHLSILFTLVPTLVSSEAEEAAAIRIFKQYDEHGSGFISVDNLVDILSRLNLFHEDDYLASLKDKLDKEHLGIILRSDFLAEFFPQTSKFHNGQMFDVFHYNGLSRSESPIRYHHGRAKILDLDLDLEIINITEDPVNGIDSDSSIVRCLRTKYPRVEIIWDESKIPSIN